MGAPWVESIEASMSTGSLVLVATPIGNLGDLSPRALSALESADLICCEDTRRTRTLLSAMDLRAAGRLVSLHEHNERDRTASVLDAVAQGKAVVVVSDAGTPGISDPGSRLVKAALDAGLHVSTVPGPSAVLAALVISGLTTDRFVMDGFLPRRGPERTKQIASLRGEERTCVLFESPRRLRATLVELAEALGDSRQAVVARELTKIHEETLRGSLAELARNLEGVEVRGEVVLLLAGAEPLEGAVIDDEAILSAVRRARENGASLRDAAAMVAEALGVQRRRVYELALSEESS
jgi:16S rRNA (cytidine1402-2'-O)-methyltransferase